MSGTVRAWACAILFICAAPQAAPAQGKARFEVYANAKEVPMNGNFQVTFTLKNANGTDFNPPGFENFIVLSGPNTSSSFQYINGKQSHEMSWSYDLQPKRLGNLRIEKATVRANGKKLNTFSLQIKSIAGNPTSSNPLENDSGATVEMLIDKTEAYLGEQVLLDFKSYSTVVINDYEFGEDPDYRGFYAHELRRYRSRAQREVINGSQVTTKVLRRIALFPQQTGELSIPSTRAQLMVVEEEDRRGILYRRSVKPVYIMMDSLKINVLPLPPGAPETFTGAVGDFQMRASVTRKEATTDNAVSVTMLLEGDGDLKRVLPPPLLLLDSFEVYPPKVLDEAISEQGGRLFGKKIIEYLILPKYPGEYHISPTFTFFDVENGAYQTLSAGPFPLSVKQGTDRQNTSRRRPDEVATVSDIQHIKREASLSKKGASFAGAPAFWSLMGLPTLAFLGLFVFKKIKEREANVDMGALKIKQASSEAQKRLATAKAHLEAGDSRLFYDEISKASLGYVCDKLSIPLAELSKDNVREKLQSLNVSEPLVDGFVKVVQTCEMALFAGMDNSADMAQTYERALAVINGIEGEVGRS